MFESAGLTPSDRLVGHNIKRERLRQGLPETALMRHLGCSSAYVAALEAGGVSLSPEAVRAVAALLNCRISDLFVPYKH